MGNFLAFLNPLKLIPIFKFFPRMVKSLPILRKKVKILSKCQFFSSHASNWTNWITRCKKVFWSLDITGLFSKILFWYRENEFFCLGKKMFSIRGFGLTSYFWREMKNFADDMGKTFYCFSTYLNLKVLLLKIDSKFVYFSLLPVALTAYGPISKDFRFVNKNPGKKCQLCLHLFPWCLFSDFPV